MTSKGGLMTKNLFLVIETKCPKCGNEFISVGPMEVVGWECATCGYYDPDYNWMSSQKIMSFALDVESNGITFLDATLLQ